MTTDRAAQLDAAEAAIARGDWVVAFDLLSALDEAAALPAVDLVRLAEAAWWTGRLGACIAARERAYAAFSRDGSIIDAALSAVELCRNYVAKGDTGIGIAWLNRADRLLENTSETAAHGYVTRMQGVVAFEGNRDFGAALALARRATEIGARHKDRNLMAIGLHDQGRILMSSGLVDEGAALADEATVAAISGELDPRSTAIIYCNAIVAYKDLGDYQRARDWTEAAKRWCDRQAIAGFPGMCRVYRAGILRMRGALADADMEARRACDELREFNRGYCASAFYELGEVRLRLGDLAGAGEAFQSAHELGRDPQPGLALLRLAEGNVGAAVAGIRRAVDAGPRDAIGRTQMLPAMVQVFLQAGAIDEAEAAVAELEAAAATFGTIALRAEAMAAVGAVRRARGETRAAIVPLGEAVSMWQSIDCPFEAALTRLELAAAYATISDHDGARIELTSARTAFERVGARLAARMATAQLASLDAATGGPSATQRETRAFLFTDIVRSTALIEAIGDAAWVDVARWHDQALRASFTRFGGDEVDHAGDGFFVAFPSAESAFACAIDIQRSLADHRRAHGFAPRVRIGLHVAPVERVEAGFRGRGVHEASRICAEADGDEIVASRAFVDALPASPPTANARRVTPRGLSDPVDLVTIEWHSP